MSSLPSDHAFGSLKAASACLLAPCYRQKAITQGLADANAGRTVDHESALARVRARIRRAS